MRDQFDPLIERLMPSWHGPFLRGLITYIDRNRTLDLNMISRFSASVDHVGTAEARARLKAIQGALTSRARATEEAVELLRRGDANRLRELFHEVLAPMGDAIPSAVRAAVALTLWTADPKHDPLPELQRIPQDPLIDGYRAECINQVEIVRTAQLLSDLCTRADRESRDPPSIVPLKAFNPPLGSLAALATALIYIGRGDGRAALEFLPELVDEQDGALALAHFHAAWQQHDTERCLGLWRGPLAKQLADRPAVGAALHARAILPKLEEGDVSAALALIIERSDGQGHADPRPTLLSLAVWLLKGRLPTEARNLLRCIGEFLSNATSPEEHRALQWTRLALSPLVHAQVGQYTACIEAVDRLRGTPAPLEPSFGNASGDESVVSWSRLIRLMAELAMVSQAGDDLRARWHSVRRSLLAQVAELEHEPRLEAYLLLIRGLLAYLSTDTLVGESAITDLTRAQSELSIHVGRGFVDEAIARLRWRRGIMDDFWQSLRENEFQVSRDIYLKELQPAFGTRMPNEIRLAMVLVDWDAEAGTDDLLHRLDILQHEAPDLSLDLLESVRTYVRDGEKVRQLIFLLQNNDHAQLAERISSMEWVGFSPGSMPLPVALLLLLAYYKTVRIDEARTFGTHLAEDESLAGWVRDDALMLLGYLLFDNREYPAAIDVFGRVSRQSVLGHDVDRYGAASHFNHGIQLLEVDQLEKAFESFASALMQTKTETATGSLGPLFIHFGLKNLETRQGGRAVQAFQTIREHLKKLAPAPEVAKGLVLAEMGDLLCTVLMSEDVEKLGGDRFLAIVDRIEASADLISHDFRVAITRAARILAICQELRRELRRQKGDRQPHEILEEFLMTQIRELEELHAAQKFHDPVLMALIAVVELRLRRGGDTANAVANIEQATKLGLQSGRLMALLDAHKKAMKKALDDGRRALGLFDKYLRDGSVPDRVKKQLICHDDLAELYRLNKNCEPSELAASEVRSGVANLCERLENLVRYAKEQSVDDDDELRASCAAVTKGAKRLRDDESKLVDLEKEIMAVLAKRIRAQSLSVVEERKS